MPENVLQAVRVQPRHAGRAALSRCPGEEIMQTQSLVALVICAVTAVGYSQKTASGQVPAGWIARGSQPQEYEMGVDRGVAHGGKASGYLKSKGDKLQGFGTLRQAFKADAYRGKRLRLSGYVKTDGVEKWTGLWMRVDGEQNSPAFDNMENRPIKGTTGWQKYEVVLDVPEGSVDIAFGILLAGKGHAWVDDLQLDVVGNDVPSTNMIKEGATPPPFDEAARKRMSERKKTLPAQPGNLNFEQ
jgi:hypothetical protein